MAVMPLLYFCQKTRDETLSRARAIELYNSERKELDQKITAQALDQIKDNQEEELNSTVVFNQTGIKEWWVL